MTGLSPAVLAGARAVQGAGGEAAGRAGAGRGGFVDAGDIAVVAVRALADAHAPNTDLVLTGPEALGYDDNAAIVTETTGRRVVHQRLAPEQMRDRHAREMPLEFATMPARYGQAGAGVPRVARSEPGRVAPGWLRGEHRSGRAGGSNSHGSNSPRHERGCPLR